MYIDRMPDSLDFILHAFTTVNAFSRLGRPIFDDVCDQSYFGSHGLKSDALLLCALFSAVPQFGSSAERA